MLGLVYSLTERTHRRRTDMLNLGMTIASPLDFAAG
jgi:hypothetical protein